MGVCLRLNLNVNSSKYPEALRRVSYLDMDTKKRFVYLTNIFTVSAITIADIYKQRWQVEIFFRWIKQHLRVNYHHLRWWLEFKS